MQELLREPVSEIVAPLEICRRLKPQPQGTKPRLRGAGILLLVGAVACVETPTAEKFQFATSAERTAALADVGGAAGDVAAIDADADAQTDAQADVDDVAVGTADVALDVPPEASGDGDAGSDVEPDVTADADADAAPEVETEVAVDPCAGKVCADDNPCTDSDCDPIKGCVFPANAATCTDGDACTTGDNCKQAACLPGATTTCDDGNACTTDSCGKASGCVNVANTATCTDDGNVCSLDVCAAGVCTHPFAVNQAPCDDKDPCTVPDGCTDGLCMGLSPKNCDDGNPCTDDSCDKGKGCVYLANAVTCSDGDACTEGDACVNKACVPGKGKTCDDANGCTDDGCDKAKGCVYLANTVTCTDINACTLGDHCASNACWPGTILTCKDGNPCTDDACLEASGCAYLPNTATCTDGDACTAGDACASSACKPGTAIKCDDGNVCTTDGCDKGKGCVNLANAVTCSDGDACTGGDACAGSACKGGAAVKCDDGNVCTADGCEKATGCVTTAEKDGTACAGGACVAGACKGVCQDGWQLLTGTTGDDRWIGGAAIGADTVLVGALNENKAGMARAARITADGKVVWTKDFGAPISYLAGAASAKDGHVWVAGEKSNDGWVARLDGSGAVVVEKSMSGDSNNTGFEVAVATGDGGVVAAGRLGVGAGVVPWVVRFDADGKPLWQHKAPGPQSSGRVSGAVLTNDGGVFGAGNSGAPGGSWKCGLLRLSPLGVQVDAQLLAEGGETYCSGVAADGGTGFFIVGTVGAVGGSPYDGLLWHLDGAAKVTWVKKYDFGANEDLTGIVPYSGGVILLGSSYTDAANRNGMPIFVSSHGQEIWHRAYDLGGYDGLAWARTLPGGRLLFAGYGNKQPGSRDLWAFTADAWGFTECQFAGACGAMSLANCDDTNPCTLDTCDPKTGCKNTPVADALPCDAGVGTCAGQCSAGKCAAPPKAIDKQVGATDAEGLRGLVSVATGGWISAGSRLSTANKKEGLLLRTDSFGNLLWEVTLGDAGDDDFSSVYPRAAGAMAAGSRSTGSDVQAWLVGVEPDGKVALEVKAGSPTTQEFVKGLAPGPNASWYVAGAVKTAGGKPDGWLARVDEAGVIAWQYLVKTDDSDYLYAAVAVPDGVVAVGSQGGFPKGDMVALRLDTGGKVVWQKTFGGADFEEARTVVVRPAGGFVAAGEYNVGGERTGRLWHLADDGNLVSSADVIAGTQVFGLTPIASGFAFVGHNAISGSSQLQFGRVDAAFKLAAQAAHGGAGDEHGNAVLPLASGYLVAGRAGPAAAGQGWLLALDNAGKVASGAACDDKNPCTLDGCDAKGGCTTTPITTGTCAVGCPPTGSGTVCGNGQGKCESGHCMHTDAKGYKWTLVPAGKFWMGCNPVTDSECSKIANENPQHEVELSAYWIGVYEVTAAQYASCSAASVKGCTVPVDSLSTVGQPGLESHPATFLAWPQASAVCNWLAGDLPSEAQWEKGARGGCEGLGIAACKASAPVYPWGNMAPTCGQHAQTCNGTAPAGTGSQQGSGPYGTYDQIGNAAEWTLDWFDASYYGSAFAAGPNPANSGAGTLKVVRGGSASNFAGCFRASARCSHQLGGSPSNIGVRCAKPAN